MDRMNRASVRILGLLPLMAAAMACDDASGFAAPEMAPSGVSRAFSAWEPGPLDTCSRQIHDNYAVVGADGKLYPTWHPPVDEATGCSFGHEHGRDPRGSDLFDNVGYIPFGYANEAADFFAPHPGFKIEWENDVPMKVGPGDVGAALFSVSCDDGLPCPVQRRLGAPSPVPDHRRTPGRVRPVLREWCAHRGGSGKGRTGRRRQAPRA